MSRYTRHRGTPARKAPRPGHCPAAHGPRPHMLGPSEAVVLVEQHGVDVALLHNVDFACVGGQ
eukprot:6481998-Prymnesium_polylepis.1